MRNILWASVTLSLLTSCVLDLPEATEALDFVVCTSADQCARDEACEMGFCVVRTGARELVDVQVTPPRSSDLVTEQFIGVEVAQGKALPDLHLQKPATVFGTVTRRTRPGIQTAATLVARRKYPSITNSPLRFQADAAATVDIRSSQGFSIRLPVGLYDMSLLPLDPSLPPQLLVDLPVEGDTLVDFIVDHPADVPRLVTVLDGKVTFEEIGGDQGAGTAVEGARVTAIDEFGRSASTVSMTDSEGGFSIALRRDVSAIRVVVAPPVGSLLPRVVFEVDTDASPFLSLSLGALHPIERVETEEGLVEPNVRGIVLSPQGEPVVSATIHFLGPLGGGMWSGSTKTGTDGRFETLMPLIPCSVLINPAPDSPEAVTEISGVDVARRGLTLVARDKVEVSGRVLNPTSTEGVEDVVLRFRRIQRSSFDQLREFTANTDFRGHYSTSVDPGWYEIEIDPPLASGFARTHLATASPITTDLRRNFVTARPNIAYGIVLDDQGIPLQGAKVEIYHAITDLGPRRVAEGRTDDTGAYRMLIPEIVSP